MKVFDTSFFSELFATSASIAALLFAVLGIASSLQEKDKYFTPDVLKNCRQGFWWLFAVCFISLFSFVLEEAGRLGVHVDIVEFQWNIYLLLAYDIVLSVMFAKGLVKLARAIHELLKALYKARSEPRPSHGTT